MIKLSFVHVMIIILGCLGVFSLAITIYYMIKYSNADTDEEKIRGFIWNFLPDFHYPTTEEFFLFLKWGFIALFIISVIYAVLFKLPVPFIGKPLFVIGR
jgi:hypothetical protein